MKKGLRAICILAIVLMLAGAVWAAPFFVSYSTKTASGLVTTGSGYYYGMKVNTDGTNSVTTVVYDNTAASGTAIDPSTVFTTSATLRAAASGSNPPRRYYKGLYVAITCAGTAGVTVEYVPD
ncbi:MAG: hypothetical protein WCY09_08945 [Candidatus Omnitrophota bacterium]|jgi:hypothetical protein